MDCSDSFFSWIRTNANADPMALRLKYAGKKDSFDYRGAITQIECRRKFGRKLQQTLASFADFYFPSVLSGEQASSDLLAEYHASLVPEGVSVVDFTSGLGIDALHMARRAASVVAVERNPDLNDALRYNAKGLHLENNIEAVCDDCVEFIDACIANGRRFDMGFIDPARRGTDGERLYALSDCSPDVVALLPKIARICRMLVIKASPMLDISHTVAVLPVRPSSVAAAGTASECKELVITIVFEGEESSQTIIESITLLADGAQTFAFTTCQENKAPTIPSSPAIKAGDTICEPYPAIMKAGAFRILAQRFGLRGFHDNTRLLFTSVPPTGFPGTLWHVDEVLPYSSSVIKRFKSRWPAISIVTRNFGMSADALRSRLGVRESPGSMKLFAVTGPTGDKILIITSR